MYSFGDLVIEPKRTGDIVISDFITQEEPGAYKSEWVIASTDRRSPFGPRIYLEVFVVKRN